MTIREQTMLFGVSGVLVAFGLWSIVWQPALQSKQDSVAQLLKIDTVQTALQTLPSIDEVHLPAQAGSLQQRVTSSALDASVDIRRLDPQGEALSVDLDDVSFATLVRWIETMTATMGVRVLAAEIGRRPEPGVVSVRLLLEDR